MALRELVGEDGRSWQVWDTRPTPTKSNDGPARARYLARVKSEQVVDLGLLSQKRQDGWLTFATDDERRRLSPIPDGWATADEPALRRLLASADRVVSSTTARGRERSP